MEESFSALIDNPGQVYMICDIKNSLETYPGPIFKVGQVHIHWDWTLQRSKKHLSSSST